jgi:hypothetical protein
MSAASFVDVTGEDGDPCDCVYQDGTPGTIHFYLIEGHGPDGFGPLGHYEQ